MTDTNTNVQDEKSNTAPVVAAEAASADENKAAASDNSTAEVKVEAKAE